MQINDIDIDVEYKNIKHIHLAVYPPDGRVHVSSPKETSEEQLRLFILAKWVWLLEKRKEVTSFNIQSEREYVSGEAHYYKGSLYRLRVDIIPAQVQRVYTEGDYLVIRCRRQENAALLLKDFYRRSLQEILSPIVEKWTNHIGIAPKAYEVLSMPTRWGSCNTATKKIMFNLELAKKPIECIEYVVLHELLHLIERNHTPRFFRLLDANMPRWKKLQDYLNELPL
jgi:predicted metal-dependent hydrolase